MNKDINLEAISTDWAVDEPESVVCFKRVKLTIYGVEHIFEAYGEAFCQDKDDWDESFGKALSWIRASQEIGNSVEQCLIKYSCTKDSNGLEVYVGELKLNTTDLEGQLDNILKKAKTVEAILNRIGGKHGK